MSETIARLAQSNAVKAFQATQALAAQLDEVRKFLGMQPMDKQPVKEPGVFIQVIQGFNQSIRNISQDLEAHGQLIDALVDMAGGPEIVGTKMAELEVKNAKLNAEAEAAAVAQALTAGQLKAVETVTDISVVVFSVTNGSGEARRLQYGFKNLNPAISKDLLGKKVGEKLTVDNFTYEVKEIYEGIPQKAPTVETETVPLPVDPATPVVMASANPAAN